MLSDSPRHAEGRDCSTICWRKVCKEIEVRSKSLSEVRRKMCAVCVSHVICVHGALDT